MSVISRGRFYEDGPYTYCDKADIHPQPCLCASKYFPAVRREILERLAREGQEAGFYEATAGGWSRHGSDEEET